jgi:hypothetical protein
MVVMAIQLLLTEVNDNQIKIGGVSEPTETMKKIASCFNASNNPIRVDVDHVETTLDDAITKAAAGAELKDNILMFKQPVVIAKAQEKIASADFTLDVASIRELERAVRSCTAGEMEKVATNQFTEDLIDAIHDAQIDSEGVMKLSMPVKLEFRDDAAKNAFLGIGRRKKAKAVKLAAAIKSVYRRQLIDLAVERLARKN